MLSKNMDLEMESEVADVISKFKELGCTMLEDADNSWIREILFKPDICKYNLLEWIFSKLKFNIPEVPGQEDSQEKRMKNLIGAVFNLGICRKNCHDIIKGIASMKDQLSFWKTLVALLWEKHCLSEFSEECDKSEVLLPSNKLDMGQSPLFETYSSRISKQCKFVSGLFKETVQLFPPDIEHQIKHHSSLNNLHEAEGRLESQQNFDTSVLKHIATSSFCERTAFNEEGYLATSEVERNDLEQNISAILSKLKGCALSNFHDTYDNLKPLISHIHSEESIDIGPEFKEIATPLESLLKLKYSLSTIKSSNINIDRMNTDLTTLEIPQQPLSDAELDNFTAILKKEKEQKVANT